MQDRPDAHELLEALTVFLFEDVLPHVPDEMRFPVRVAANCCAILARETRAGPDRAGQAERGREIRSGAWDDRWDEALAVLRDSVRGKLAVAHPGYDDFADDGRG
jgi:Domain of unknown function (DUF6285)